MRKKLLIISHTEHYLQNGKAIGWGPTITEINFLAQYWEEVVHVACLHPGEAPGSSLPYTSENIRFVAIPPFGGPTWKHKLGILNKMPSILKKIRKELKGASEVQLRLPTGIGVFLLPWFSLRKRNYTFWVKYAGNWAQEYPPLGYAFQRWWLKKNFSRCKVTINGKWPDQPEHCLSFENPCLTEEEVINARPMGLKKEFKPPYKLLFVGQLKPNKGVNRIIEALKAINGQLVSEMIFAGDGPDIEKYRSVAANLEVKCSFLGFQIREKVHELMRDAHFILLPSDSEGFPKVIAEAACYGTIPIVSGVSSIPQYVNQENGFLWDINTSFGEYLNSSIITTLGELKTKSRLITQVSNLFTFESFYSRLEQQII